MSTLALHAAGRSVRRTRISLTHASVLIVLSVGLAGNALAGAFFGAGAYPFLEANRVAAGASCRPIC